MFERRQKDARGGEGSERIGSLHERPVFSLHVGASRGATWFETGRPPKGIVWLLGVEPHDEGRKGRDDAYDRFARQEKAGTFYPVAADYKLLELARRSWDSEKFSEQAIEDASRLLSDLLKSPAGIEGTVVGIGIRIRQLDDALFAVAVSQQSVHGMLSGEMFPLTYMRYLLVVAAFEKAGTALGKGTLAEEPLYEFPGGLRDERAFLLMLG